MNLETAFLSELDSREIYSKLRNKVEGDQLLSDEELMEFIILPLAYRTKEEKQQQIVKHSISYMFILHSKG